MITILMCLYPMMMIMIYKSPYEQKESLEEAVLRIGSEY